VTGLGLALALTALALLVVPAGASADVHYRATADESLADIQAYWAEALPATYGRTYRAIPSDRVFPYSSDDPPPGCGTRGTTPYREVAGNAFYCEEDDFVAYDVEGLIPALRKRYGDVAVGLVLAHEMGHAVQARVGAPDGAFVYTELQADCFAGSWARHIARGEGTDLRLSADDLDRALAGFLDLRDPSGTDGGEPGAHGNAFDRVSAFQDGLTGGATTCKRYETDPPEVTEAGFVSYEDQAVNGDPPLDESLPMVTKSLDAYWHGVAPRYDGAPRLVAARSSSVSCSGGSDGGVLSDTVLYCADEDSIVYSSATLQKASDEIGDMGAGVYIAAAWASAVQHDLGNRIGTARARSISECLTGAWAGAVERGTTTSNRNAAISFSPGDLDEVIAAFVATDGTASTTDRGTVFDRVALFRTGFAGGPSACLTT
jgi:predicted metalloprotease